MTNLPKSRFPQFAIAAVQYDLLLRAHSLAVSTLLPSDNPKLQNVLMGVRKD